jgi:hypothetical protein
VDIAGCFHGEISQGVLRKRGKHVIKERHRRINGAGTSSIKVERELNLRFAGCSRDARSTRCLSHVSSLAGR